MKWSAYFVFVAPRFNSLQTGKCIQSIEALDEVLGDSVSIPFKRESVFRVIPSQCVINELSLSFNSLQTGKCIQRQTQPTDVQCGTHVSIPFKRESVFRELFFTGHARPM